MILPPAKQSYQPETRTVSGWNCAHPETRFVRHVVKNGAIHYREQCQVCGDGVRHIPKHERMALAPDDIGEWDESIRTRWWEARSEQYWLARQQRTDAWFEEASDYYSSIEWRRKSIAVIERDQICQACRHRPATEAHHLTCAHWMNEPLFDLVGVCHPCHEKITSMDRERRVR